MGATIFFRLAAVLGSLVLFGTSFGSGDTDGWVKFSSPEGRFEILMPGKPVTGETIEMQFPAFTAEVHPFWALRPPSLGLMCGYADFPFAPKNPRDVFDHARDGSLANVKGKLITEKDVMLEGFLGRRFRSTAQGSSFIDEEMYLVGRRLYLITIFSKTEEPDSNIDKILNSFRFTPMNQ